MGKNKKCIVITVIGKDEVGIVAKVASALAENNINIIDINQKIPGGVKSAIFWAGSPAGSTFDVFPIIR